MNKLMGVEALTLLLVACDKPKAAIPYVVTVPDTYGAKVSIVRMPDGATCYVATESGHGIAMHCMPAERTLYNGGRG